MIEERPVWIALNGVRRIVLSCSPHDVAELAFGHLLAEGWIRTAHDIQALSVTESGPHAIGVHADIDAALVESMEHRRRHQTLHGCGLRHVLDCETEVLSPVTSVGAPGDAGALLRSLFAATDHAAPDGGVHGVAVSDGVSLVAVALDVARHCAVDRAIGSAVRSGADLTRHGLVCTARISGGMALKAVRCGLGWMASRSVATSLAHEIAAAHGMLVLERARRSRAR